MSLPWATSSRRTTLPYLLKYDSTQGRFDGVVSSAKSSPDKADDDILIINGKEIQVVSARTPAELPWGQIGRSRWSSNQRGYSLTLRRQRAILLPGQKKVIISAPAKNEDITLVLGV